MRSFPPADTLYLDFDGVLCDSLEECYRSSWLAREGIAVGKPLPPEPPADPEYRARFRACRPFVRSGEDYLVVHDWAARGAVPHDQAEFDASLTARGPEQMARLKDRLYAVREQLLEQHRGLWLSWNPLYAGIGEALRSQADNPAVWILSTKKAEFITEILRKQEVSWPADRTVYTGPRRKLDLIAELNRGKTAVLVDDQIDHLDFASATVSCYLALWGYVSPGAADRAGAAMDLAEAAAAVTSFRGRRPSA